MSKIAHPQKEIAAGYLLNESLIPRRPAAYPARCRPPSDLGRESNLGTAVGVHRGFINQVVGCLFGGKTRGFRASTAFGINDPHEGFSSLMNTASLDLLPSLSLPPSLPPFPSPSISLSLSLLRRSEISRQVRCGQRDRRVATGTLRPRCSRDSMARSESFLQPAVGLNKWGCFDAVLRLGEARCYLVRSRSQKGHCWTRNIRAL